MSKNAPCKQSSTNTPHSVNHALGSGQWLAGLGIIFSALVAHGGQLQITPDLVIKRVEEQCDCRVISLTKDSSSGDYRLRVITRQAKVQLLSVDSVSAKILKTEPVLSKTKTKTKTKSKYASP